MGIEVKRILFCDRCQNDFGFGIADTNLSTKELRAMAAEEGWTRKGKKDVCEFCSK